MPDTLRACATCVASADSIECTHQTTDSRQDTLAATPREPRLSRQRWRRRLQPEGGTPARVLRRTKYNVSTCLASGARIARGLCSERWERPTKRAPSRRWNVLCIPRPSPAQQSVYRPNGCAPQDDACGRAPQYAIAGLRGTGASTFAAAAADTISMCFKWVLSGERERQRSLAGHWQRPTFRTVTTPLPRERSARPTRPICPLGTRRRICARPQSGVRRNLRDDRHGRHRSI